MASLSCIRIAAPEHHVTVNELKAVSERWLRGDEPAQEKFLRIGTQSGVATRAFILPYDQILDLNGLEHRAKCFEASGTQLLTHVIQDALDANHCSPEDIGALVFTSCSVPMIPSIDATAALACGLSPSVTRVPMYQHGCAGGVVGLALGAKLSTLGKPVIVASVELCSLVFQPNNHTGAHLVGAAIFADGAAATVISPSAGPVSIVGSASHLLPGTRHLMGYDIFDDGFHLRLDRSLPSALVNAAPNVVHSFLTDYNLAPHEIDYWLFHPGGVKILEFLRSCFALTKEQCRWSYDVLRDHGNLSSATILYVVDQFLRSGMMQPGRTALIMGIGPGLTVELILLQS